MLTRTLKLLLPFANCLPAETKELQNKIFAISKGQIERFKSMMSMKRDKKESYEYPLVQFRSENGKGALFAINEGIDDLRIFFEQFNDKNHLKTIPFQQWQETFHHLMLTHEGSIYRIFHCALMNSANYENYLQIDGGYRTELERTIFLEKILTNQIINFCNGVQFKFPRGNYG
jgi:hypothetical protein